MVIGTYSLVCLIEKYWQAHCSIILWLWLLLFLIIHSHIIRKQIGLYMLFIFSSLLFTPSNFCNPKISETPYLAWYEKNNNNNLWDEKKQLGKNFDFYLDSWKITGGFRLRRGNMLLPRTQTSSNTFLSSSAILKIVLMDDRCSPKLFLLVTVFSQSSKCPKPKLQGPSFHQSTSPPSFFLVFLLFVQFFPNIDANWKYMGYLKNTDSLDPPQTPWSNWSGLLHEY